MNFVILLICLQISIYPTVLTDSVSCLAWDAPCLTTLGQNLERDNLLRIAGLNTLKLDPFEIDYFKLVKDGLVIEIRDTKVHGLKNLVVEEFKADANTSMIHAKLRTEMFITGYHKSSGSLLYLPMNGEGDYWLSLSGALFVVPFYNGPLPTIAFMRKPYTQNVEIDALAKYNIVKNENGEDFLEATDYKFSYDVKDNDGFHLNGFNYGFSGLSELLHYLMKNNWKYVTSKYVNGFIANAVENLVKIHKSYFRLEPFKFYVQ